MISSATMNSDGSCQDTDNLVDIGEPAVDLTIILETTWPFEDIQSIIS